MRNEANGADMESVVTKTKIDPLLQAVVMVRHGRGFVIEHGNHRLVLTAAHCLPILPKPHPASYLQQRTFKTLLGPLGGKRKLWAELLFADPIADIAVLGSPDDQALPEQAEAYEALVEQTVPLTIGDAPKQGAKRVQLPVGNGSFDVATPGRGDAHALSLDGKRLTFTVTRTGMWLAVDDGKFIKAGMSGSPIISPDGHAIALISTGPQNPVLVDCLPTRFLRP
jgi:hypothetical protein